jgi:hypothetical protein
MSLEDDLLLDLDNLEWGSLLDTTMDLPTTTDNSLEQLFSNSKDLLAQPPKDTSAPLSTSSPIKSPTVLVLRQTGFITDPNSTQVRPIYQTLGRSLSGVDCSSLDGLYLVSSQSDGGWSSPRPVMVADVLQLGGIPPPHHAAHTNGHHQRAASWSGSRPSV